MAASSWRDAPRSAWPTLGHAMRIIESDLAAAPDWPVHLTVRPEAACWSGWMWQNGLDGRPLGAPIAVMEASYEDVIRHLAGIIAANRLGGVVP
jgi:hypothetical protein